MTRLLTIILTLALALGACATDTDLSTEELGATLDDLSSEAQALLSEADLDAQLANAIDVVANNATTVGLAATGGEVSDTDLAALTRALDDLQAQVDTARESLDPEVEQRIDDLESDLRAAVDELD